MNCPYCNGELIEGYLLGEKYSIKWLPKDAKLFLGIFAINSISLGSSGTWKRARVESLLCSKCKKIIIDINN